MVALPYVPSGSGQSSGSRLDINKLFEEPNIPTPKEKTINYDQARNIRRQYNGLQTVAASIDRFENAFKDTKAGPFGSDVTPEGIIKRVFGDGKIGSAIDYALLTPEQRQAAAALQDAIRSEYVPIRLSLNGIQPTESALKEAHDTFNIQNLGLHGIKEAVAQSLKNVKMSNIYESNVSEVDDIAQLYGEGEEGLQAYRNERPGIVAEHAIPFREALKEQSLIKNRVQNPSTPEIAMQNGELAASGIDRAMKTSTQNGKISESKFGEAVADEVIGKPTSQWSARDIRDFISTMSIASIGLENDAAINTAVYSVAALLGPAGPVVTGAYTAAKGAIEAVSEYKRQEDGGDEIDFRKIAAAGAGGVIETLGTGFVGKTGLKLIGKFAKKAIGAGTIADEIDSVTQGTLEQGGSQGRNVGKVEARIRKDTSNLLKDKSDYGNLTSEDLVNKMRTSLPQGRATDDLIGRIERNLKAKRDAQNPSESVFGSLKDLSKKQQIEEFAKSAGLGSVKGAKDFLRLVEDKVFPKMTDLTNQAGITAKIKNPNTSSLNAKEIAEEINTAKFSIEDKIDILPSVFRKVISPKDLEIVEQYFTKGSIQSKEDLAKFALDKISGKVPNAIKIIQNDLRTLIKELKIPISRLPK